MVSTPCGYHGCTIDSDPNSRLEMKKRLICRVSRRTNRGQTKDIVASENRMLNLLIVLHYFAATMKIGLVIITSKPEPTWNAFRYGVEALDNSNSVKAFMLERAAENERTWNSQFDVAMMEYEFVDKGGVVLDCGRCLEIRGNGGPGLCPNCKLPGTIDLTADSDRVIAFA